MLNDFGFDAYFAGIGAVGYFYGAPEAVATATAPRGLQAEARLALEALRGAISARIRAVLSGDTGAFAASMVTDDRRAISKETTEALQLAGLTHIVAISGLNMALAAGIFFVGIRALLSLSQTVTHLYPVKRIAAAGALLTVTGYYLISGFAVSAQRAYIMMAIMLVAAILGRPSISLRNVALSAIVILVLSPSAVMGPGFQMSFAATLALVAGYALWQRRGEGDEALPGLLGPLRTVWTFAAGVFVTSLIGGLSTALFSIEHFNRIAAWGLPANLLAMPVISLIVMPCGVIALLLMPVGLDWLPLKLMGFGLDIVIMIAKWFAAMGGDIVIGRIHGWLFVGLSISLVVLAVMRSRLRFAGLAAAVGLLGINFMVPGVPKSDFVVHEEGGLVALVDGDRIATTQEKPNRFIFDQWQRALPAREHVKPVMKPSERLERRRKPLSREERQSELASLDSDLKALPGDRFVCRQGRWCATRLRNNGVLIMMELRELVGYACDRASVVVTPVGLNWSACRSGALLLSRPKLRRTGSIEVSIHPENIRVFRVSAGLGMDGRPWYIHRTYDWRSGEYLRTDDQLPRTTP